MPIAVLLPVGYLSDKFNRPIMVTITTFVSALFTAAIVITDSSVFILILALAVIVGGFGHPIYSLGVSYSGDRFDSSEIVSINGTLLVIFSIGTAIGPLVAGSLMDVFGTKGLYMFLLSIFLSLFVISFVKVVNRTATIECS